MKEVGSGERHASRGERRIRASRAEVRGVLIKALSGSSSTGDLFSVASLGTGSQQEDSQGMQQR